MAKFIAHVAGQIRRVPVRRLGQTRRFRIAALESTGYSFYSRPLSRRASAEWRIVERMRKRVAAGIEATSSICVRPEARRNERRRDRGPIRVHSLRRESCFRMALTGCQRRSIPSSYIEVPLSWQFAIRRLTLCFTMPACHPCRRIQSLVKDRQSWGCLVPTSAHALPAYVIYAHDNMAEACGSRTQTSNFQALAND
jgi:hypothetical protein